MDLALLVFLCLLAPLNTTNVPAESVAIVNLQDCLRFAPTFGHDKGILSKDIRVADAEGRELLNHQKKMEALSTRDAATELDRLNARVAKLEFDAFRRREQSRLREAEEAMFKKWHKQVNAAVKLVAQRERITVVLYLGKDLNEVEGSAIGTHQMLTQTHVGFVDAESRPDITDRIIEEMRTAAFVEVIEKENSKSEQ